VSRQPLPTYWQHHTFFRKDQPSCQFQKPAAQSKSVAVVKAVVVLGTSGQPSLSFWQHQAFLVTDQAACQLFRAAWQSKGGGGTVGGTGVSQPCPVCVQHHLFLLPDQPVCHLSSPAAQSKGQPMPLCWQHQALLPSGHDNHQFWASPSQS